MRTRALVLLALPASLACSSTQPRVRPEVLARHPLTYEASLRGQSLPAAEGGGAEALGERTVEIDVVLLALAPGEAAALEGERFAGPQAWSARRAALEPYLDLPRSGDARVLTAPRLLAAEGQTCTLAVTRELAYVADFELRGDERALVADPVVESVRTGVLLQASAAFTANGGVELALDVRQSDLETPIAERRARLPGLEEPVVIQTPRLCAQRVATRAELGAGECLVVSWNGADDGRVLALVTAGEAAPAGSR